MILVNGAFFEGNKAELDFSDRGLMLGDGLFETLPVLGGEIFMRDVHLDRLERGLGVLGILLCNAPDFAVPPQVAE